MLYTKVGHLYQDDRETVDWINKNSEYRNSIANIIDRKLDVIMKKSPITTERNKGNSSGDIPD